jgi:tetratricopeptide (TPR) repeat protein
LFSQPDKKNLALLLFIIFLALFLANLWGFTVVVHDIYFWLCTGILLLVSGKEIPIPQHLFYKTCAVFIFLGAGLSLFLQINSYRTDHWFLTNGASLQIAQLNPFVPAYAYQAAASGGPDADEALRHLQHLTHGEDYQAALLQADRLMQAGDTAAARTRYQQLAKKYPAMPAVYLAWGDFEKEQNNFSACSSVYQNLLQLGPNYWQYDDNITTQPTTVQERYRIFFKENPNFRDIFANLSWCALQARDFSTVLQYAWHMADSPQKYAWLGTASLATGQNEVAQKYFEICRKLSDNERCN